MAGIKNRYRYPKKGFYVVQPKDSDEWFISEVSMVFKTREAALSFVDKLAHEPIIMGDI